MSLSDLEIAKQAVLLPLSEIAAQLGLSPSEFVSRWSGAGSYLYDGGKNQG